MYRVSNNPEYYKIADNFWYKMVNDYMYSIGGVAGARNPNNAECFVSQPGTLYENGFAAGGQNETCATYNLLKLTSYLFRFDQQTAYMDYYERALYNHILASVAENSPANTYHVPLRPGSVKQFGNPHMTGFTCCNGTAIESSTKLQNTIYFKSRDDQALYVNLYIPSTLEWTERNVTVDQTTSFPHEDNTRLTIKGSGKFDIHVRVPGWATKGFFVKINGREQKLSARPGSYLKLSRNWKDGDVIELKMPFDFHLDPVMDQQNIASLFYGPILLAAQEPDGDLSADPEDKKFNWDLSATYRLSEDVNLYARAATGYRGSSIQAAGAFNAKSVAGPETSTSIEAGIKADLWEKRARLNAGLFYYRVKDQQLTAVGGTGNANILLNAEKTIGKGFEMDFQAYLTDNLLVTLGSSYNDTEIKDSDLNVAGCVACTVTDEPVINPVTGEPTGSYYIGGNELPQAPKWTHNLTARWGLPMDNGNEFYVYTDWMYRDELNFFLYDSIEFTGKSSLEGGLRVGYGWGYGDYEVALFGRNITDQRRIVGGIDFNNLTGFINEPRTVGVEFSARF